MVAAPLPHQPGGPHNAEEAMDADMGEPTFVQQNVAMDIDQTNIQQNNLQQVHIEATQNQFQQVNVGVDPAVAIQLQNEAHEAEHRARSAEIASFLNKTSFTSELARVTALCEAETARAQAAQEAGARMTQELIQQGRAAVAAASEDASNARAHAAAATGEAIAARQSVEDITREAQAVQQRATEIVTRRQEEYRSASQRINELEGMLAQMRVEAEAAERRSRRPPRPAVRRAAEHFDLTTPPRSRGDSPGSAQSPTAEATPSNRSRQSDLPVGAEADGYTVLIDRQSRFESATLSSLEALSRQLAALATTPNSSRRVARGSGSSPSRARGKSKGPASTNEPRQSAEPLPSQATAADQAEFTTARSPATATAKPILRSAPPDTLRSVPLRKEPPPSLPSAMRPGHRSRLALDAGGSSATLTVGLSGFCSRCGAGTPEHAAFCWGCGAPKALPWPSRGKRPGQMPPRGP